MNNLRSKGLHELLLFFGKFIRHHKDYMIPPVQCGKSDAQSGITGSSLHDGPAGLQQTSFFRICNHVLPYTVFHAASRIAQFQFDEDINAGRRADVM